MFLTIGGMPILTRSTPLLDSDAPAIAVPANCYGVPEGAIGRAIAAEHPTAQNAYLAAARGKQLAVGRVAVGRDKRGRLVVFVPVRVAPGDRVTLDVVEDGLEALRAFLLAQRIDRVALPLLGSGPGALGASAVRPRFEALLGALSATVELHT